MAPDSALLRSLATLNRRYPLERKLLVAPNAGVGRELLRRLARSVDGWVGFEVTTVRPLALRIARDALDRAGLQVLDAFEEQALLDEALDEALPGADGSGRLRELAEGVGFREAVHDAVKALRLHGIDADAVRRAPLADREKRRLLARMLDRHAALLTQRRRADTAAVLIHTLEILDGDPQVARSALGGQVVALLPGLSVRGLSGRVVEALQELGAGVLETDPVRGLEAPRSLLWSSTGAEGELSWLHAVDDAPAEPEEPVSVELVHAASVSEELRAVLRRIQARELRWDEVELVTPDAAAYGSTLHELASRLGIPVTYAVGLPVERTRPGRVVRTYLDWIAEGFQAAPIRRLLEAGDLRPGSGRGEHAPADLARRFRRLRIGWGRLRYRTQIRGALAALDDMTAGRHEGEARFQRRLERTRSELQALRNILFPALRATPSVPDRLGEAGPPVSPSELASGLRAFLRKVAPGDGADAAALEQLQSVLERVEVTLRRRTDFQAAVTILRRHLEIRVRAPEPAPRTADDRGAPWRSEGGHLHLADLDHGGYTGRPHLFLVGLDADRVPGPQTQDPVLLDRDRRALPGDLPTGTDLLRERTFRMAAFLARLRGSLTAGYASWSAAEGRVVQPSSLLLHLLRLRERNPALSFEELHQELGAAACALPAPDTTSLDDADLWMRALDDDGILRSGLDAVRASFPGLDRGLDAQRARRAGSPGPYHGVVSPLPERLDPRAPDGPTLSASRLEKLGTCGLRYLYDSVLKVRAPDDLELDPDRWLDPLVRGALLHDVFERALREARDGGIGTADPGLEEVALQALERALEQTRAEIPSPGAGVRRREEAGLREDVRSFVRMVRDEGAQWVRLELGFGFGEDPPLPIEVEGGTIRLRGAVDRVDEDLEGLHVVDYKTGKAYGYAGNGVFHGGRRLQHALYALAAEHFLRRDVVGGAYHFPTRRGENQAFPFPREALAPVSGLLGPLLEAVAAGRFLPTDEEKDCTFCDYAEVCRVSRNDWGKVDSPLANWSAERLNTGMAEEFTHLRAVRGFED